MGSGDATIGVGSGAGTTVWVLFGPDFFAVVAGTAGAVVPPCSRIFCSSNARAASPFCGAAVATGAGAGAGLDVTTTGVGVGDAGRGFGVAAGAGTAAGAA